jgi:hypothetical protein
MDLTGRGKGISALGGKRQLILPMHGACNGHYYLRGSELEFVGTV